MTASGSILFATAKQVNFDNTQEFARRAAVIGEWSYKIVSPNIFI